MTMRWTEMTYFWRIVSKGPWELRSIATYKECVPGTLKRATCPPRPLRSRDTPHRAKHAKNLRSIQTQWAIGTHPSVYSGWHCSWCVSTV